MLIPEDKTAFLAMGLFHPSSNCSVLAIICLIATLTMVIFWARYHVISLGNTPEYLPGWRPLDNSTDSTQRQSLECNEKVPHVDCRGIAMIDSR